MLKASILIRSHNAQDTIERAVKSAVSQDYPEADYEIVIVDDGSSDNTRKILQSFGSLPNVDIIEQENKGGTAAVLRGFDSSQGKYITILDDDDEFDSYLLKELCPILDNESNIDFAYSDYCEEFNGKNKIISPKNIFETVAIGILFRKENLIKEGFHREGILFAEYDLLLRTMEKWRGYHLKKPLFTYHRGLLSQSADPKKITEGIRQLEELHPDKFDEIKKIRSYEIFK